MIKKPSVLFLIHLPPPWHGSSIVGKTIYEDKLLHDLFHCFFVNLLASRSIRETGKFRFEKIKKFFSLFIRIVSIIIRSKPNLCYFAVTVTGIGFLRDLIIITVLKLFRIKIVYHLHNKGIRLKEKNFLNHIFYKYTFKDSEVIILSKHLYPDVSNYVNSEKVHVCPNGIEEKITYSIRNEKNSAPVILFFSNLIASKGVFILLQACAILKGRGVSFNCYFIGEEGDLSSADFQERVVGMKLTEEVKYLGPRYGEEKEEIFSIADIFAFPTFYQKETFGLVNLEAMKHSLPVVSTYEGGIPDIVENGVTGFLVPQRNVESLADKLEILLKDPSLRHQMGEQGRRKFINEFTQEIFEKRISEILVKITECRCKEVYI
jgi:glycosyltransferase involved in cell wall biosynthesis